MGWLLVCLFGTEIVVCLLVCFFGCLVAMMGWLFVGMFGGCLCLCWDSYFSGLGIGKVPK